MRHDRFEKGSLGHFFPKNALLTQLCNMCRIWVKIIKPFLPSNYISWFTLQKSWNVVWCGTIVRLNYYFWLRVIWTQFGPNLCSLRSHDFLSKDLFDVLWHHEIQETDEISLSHFCKNLVLRQYGPNQEPSVLWYALCGFFLNFVTWRYTVGIQLYHSILAKYLFWGKMENLDPIWAKVMQPYFAMLTMI